MGIFEKQERAVALIDIGSGSVGGAYALFPKGEVPVICYTARVPLERRGASLLLSDLALALHRLLARMTEEGAPTLFNLTGSGSVRRLFATVASPWQESAIGRRTVERPEPFFFSEELLKETLREGGKTITADMVAEEAAVIATSLDGYALTKPLGKRARKAELTTLTTVVSSALATLVSKSLAGAFHQKNLVLGGFPRALYEGFEALFPHEQDFLILEVRGEATDLLLVKRKVLQALTSFPQGVRDILKDLKMPVLKKSFQDDKEKEGEIHLAKNMVAPKIFWQEELVRALTALANQEPLPQRLFLLTDSGAEAFLKSVVTQIPPQGIRLIDEPFSITSILGRHVSDHVRFIAGAALDPFLSLIALSYARRKTN